MSRSHDEDVRELRLHAVEAVESALIDGEKKYQAGDWLKIQNTDHLHHLIGHLFRFIDCNPWDEAALHELDHLICRAAIVRAKLNRERLT